MIDPDDYIPSTSIVDVATVLAILAGLCAGLCAGLTLAVWARGL